MELRNRRGFTLIEVIVVAAIIAILAGILVPMIFNQIDESKISKATGDCTTIKTAIGMLQKDVGVLPLKLADGTAITALYGEGWTPGGPGETQLTGLGYVGFGSRSKLEDHLTANDSSVGLAANNGGAGGYDVSAGAKLKWKGPYIPAVSADPWGNFYFIDAASWNDTATTPQIPVWILSAGPNGTFETAPGAATLAGDDIGIRVR